MWTILKPLKQFLANKTLNILNFSYKIKFKVPKSEITKKYFMNPYYFLGLFGGVTLCYTTYDYTKNLFQNLYEKTFSYNLIEDFDEKIPSREKRFIRFASIKYKDQLFMTPRDFLESLIQVEPNLQKETRILTKNELTSIISSSINPPIIFGDTNKGIISYMEYLFLLSILKKPESGFKIAFDMLDTDENQTIGRNEFLIMEKIFNHKLILKGNRNKKVFDNTTLTVYFFGIDGTKKLTYEQFHAFIINLQNEVLKFEFNQYSNSSKISELDFVKMLLKHSNLEMNEYNKYLQRVLNRLQNPTGITFEEFENFNKLINNLDDVSIVMRMYKLADHSISKKDFLRISKICGCSLSQNLIDSIFDVFDVDGNGLLDYNEFIIVMRNRINRGFMSHEKHSWKRYQNCVRNEMKTAKFIQFKNSLS